MNFVTVFRRAASHASDLEIAELVGVIRSALEGDSNDAEHDALVEVAGFFNIDYTPFDDLDDPDLEGD